MSIRTLASGRECPDFEAGGTTGKRCVRYDDGGCALTEHPVCEEWLKVNSDRMPGNLYAKEFLTAHPEYRFAVVSGTYFTRGWRERVVRLLQPDPSPSGDSSKGEGDEREPQSPFVVKGLPSEIEVASWKALGVEVCMHSESLGEVWLVPSYTDADRKEITPEHALTLCRLVSVFPGAHVAEFVKSYVEA